MRIFASFADRVPDAASDRLPLIAGLSGAAMVAWLLVSVLGVPQDWPAAAAGAAGILLIVGANVLGVRVAGGVLRQSVDGLAFRSCPAAAWLAPLAVYLGSGSVYAIPLAAMVAGGVAPLFRPPEEGAGRVADDGRIFHLLESPPLSRLLSLVGAGFCIEAGVASGAAGTVGLAAAFISTAAAVIAWHGYVKAAVSVGQTSREVVSAGLTLVLAIVLTTAALGSGGGDGMENAAGEGPGGQYWGVFLWTTDVSTRLQPVMTAPPSSRAQADDRIKLPLKIRFDGVYWFFKWPSLRPPAGAAVMHGTPEDLGFRSVDEIPLLVEAHQHLSDHVELRGYERIEVTVSNADVYPGTVQVELVLIDSRIRAVQVSLGQVAVGSARSFQRRLPVETLSFPVPVAPALSSFDELTIRFHLHPARATRSPRIAVDDLVLVPRFL